MQRTGLTGILDLTELTGLTGLTGLTRLTRLTGHTELTEVRASDICFRGTGFLFTKSMQLWVIFPTVFSQNPYHIGPQLSQCMGRRFEIML